mgnify:CR=1 FL=1
MGRIKQVIIIRKDLKMTKGKMIAQGSHASLGVVLGMMEREIKEDGSMEMSVNIDKDSPLTDCLENIFTKICVYVNSEEELESVYQQALDKNLPSCMITDRGLTHFKGVPTKTAVAIGPCFSEDVDEITSSLRLL